MAASIGQPFACFKGMQPLQQEQNAVIGYIECGGGQWRWILVFNCRAVL